MKFDFSALSRPSYPIQVELESICTVETEGSRRQFHKKAEKDKYFLCLTVRGTGEITSDGIRAKVRENSLLLLRPENECAYRGVGEVWDFWWVEFYGPPMLNGLGQPYTVAEIEEAGLYLEKCLELSKRGLAKGASGLLAVLLAVLGEEENALQTSGKLPALAVRFVSNHLDSVTVASLCQYLDVSDRTLRNLFHRWFDMSPKRYILKCRMELARQLLEETSFSIGEVAAQLGFANPFHFSGSFKVYYGISPTEYRKNGVKALLI